MNGLNHVRHRTGITDIHFLTVRHDNHKGRNNNITAALSGLIPMIACACTS